MRFLAFCLVRQMTREGMSGLSLETTLTSQGIFGLYRRGRRFALRFDEISITPETRPETPRCASFDFDFAVVPGGLRKSCYQKPSDF